MKKVMVAVLSLLLLTGVAMAADRPSNAPSDKFTLSSPAFEDHKQMDPKHKYDNQNISPALNWTNPPPNTKSFSIVCEDLDASWTHWEIYNIPASHSALPENVPQKKVWKDGITQEANSFGIFGWGGPRPPRGVHRYEFTIYALDVEKIESTAKSYIKSHTLGTAKLVGLSK